VRLVQAICLLTATLVAESASAETPVTFSRDVAPILFAKCSVCHHPGGSGPFSLLTYASARAHSTQIAAVTGSGAMPPWQGGGEMIRTVSFEKTTYAEPPHRFEAGTPSIAGAVGLGAAIDWEWVGRQRTALVEYK